MAPRLPDRQAFLESGVAVLERLLPAPRCEAAVRAFADEVRPYAGPLLRQASTREEPHRLSRAGFVTNALLGFHDHADRFPAFCEAALGLVTHPDLRACLAELLGDTPKLVESMAFESGLGTGVHADAHYMDSTDRGAMVGAWIALEDIDERAGRFYVWPRSHLLGTDAFAAVKDAWAEYVALSVETSRGFKDGDA